MSSTVFEAYIPLTQRLKTRSDGDWLVAFALKYFFTQHRMERMQLLHKAEHKREEHEKREHRPYAERADRPAGGRRERSSRGDRAVRGVESRAEGRAEGRGEGRARRARARSDREVATESHEGEVRANGAEPRAVPVVEVSVERAPAGEVQRADAPAEPQERTPPRGRVFVSLGQRDGADEAKVREAVAALAPGLEVKAIQVRQSHSFVEVDPDAVEGAVAALDGKEFEGKGLTAERARRRRR